MPSESILRDVLIRVDPTALDEACQQGNQAYARDDASLAVDGKTMRNAKNEQGEPTHIPSVVGHETGICHTRKKSAHCP